jgi:hypothetical protein
MAAERREGKYAGWRDAVRRTLSSRGQVGPDADKLCPSDDNVRARPETDIQ